MGIFGSSKAIFSKLGIWVSAKFKDCVRVVEHAVVTDRSCSILTKEYKGISEMAVTFLVPKLDAHIFGMFWSDPSSQELWPLFSDAFCIINAFRFTLVHQFCQSVCPQ